VDELRLPIEFREPAIVDARRRSLEALDGTVRRSMRPLAAGLFAVASAVTIYDAVYPSTPEVGGFWTVASRWMGLITHSITSYTVSLEFDGQNRPDRFIVSGAREVRTSDASPEALERAVDEVRRAGPLTTVAPHAFTGFAF
jgi:hypothetical protein